MSNITKKIVAIVTGLTISLMMAGPAFSLTADELATQIAALQAQLTALTAQLAALQGAAPAAGVPAACTGITFDRNLKLGMTGADVKCLQALLNTDAATKVAETGAGSLGAETTYFGSLTQAAVVKFQEKYAADCLTPLGLTTGTGFVGIKTRAKLNSLLVVVACTTDADCLTGYTCTAGTCVVKVPPTFTGLKVELAADTPAAARILSGEGRRDFAKLVFSAGTADVTITELYLRRAGYSGDSDISNVYLYEGETLIKSSASFTTGKVRFAAANLLTIPAGTSKTITVKVDIASTIASGETVKFGIESATDITTSATILGTFPIYGNEMTAISVGDLATLSIDSPGGAGTTIDAGKTNVTVFLADLTAVNFDVSVKKIKFTNLGTTEYDALQNLKLLVNGVQKGSALASLATDNTLTFDFSADPILVTTLESVSIILRADILKGSGRTFRILIDRTTDLVAVDTNYNVGISASGIPTTGVLATTISAGALTPTLATDTPAGNIVLRAIGVPLVKYQLAAVGEDIKVSKLTFQVTLATSTGTTTATLGISNLKVFFDGNWYGAPVNASCALSATTSCATTTEFTNLEFTVPAGTTKDLIVKGDIVAPTGAYIYANNTVKVGLTAVSSYDNAKRLESGTYFSFPLTAVTAGTTLTITTASISAYSNLPAALNFTADAVDAKISSFIVQPTITEIARIERVTVNIAGTVAATEMLKLKISWSDEVMTDVNIDADGEDNVFYIAPALEIAPNEQKTLDIFVTYYGADSTETTTVAVTIAGKGKTSGTSISGAQTGSTVTIQVPVLTPAFENDPLSDIVLANSTGVYLATYSFTADYREYYLDQITIKDATGLIKQAWLKYGTTETGKLSLIAGIPQTFVLSPELLVPADDANVVEVYGTFKSMPTETPITTSGNTPQIVLTKYREKGQLETDIFDINANAMQFRRTRITVTGKGGTGVGTPSAAQTIKFVNIGANAAYAAAIEAATTTLRVTAGAATTSLSAQTIYLKRGGVTVATTSLSTQTVGPYTGVTVTLNFPATSTTAYAQNGIPAGSSYDFDIVMDTTGMITGSTLRFTITAATNVTWTDAAVTGITSTYITTFPAEGTYYTY